MYTHLLVPVDGSPTSDRGLDDAVKLAKLTGAWLRLIHVVRGHGTRRHAEAMNAAHRVIPA